MNLEKEPTCQSFYANQTAIETILNTIKNKIQQDNTNWRIDLVSLSSPASETRSSLPPLRPRQEQQQYYEPQQQDSQLNCSSLLTVVNSEDLKRKLEESHDNEKRQKEQISSLWAQVNELRAKVTINESIYNYKLKEEACQHWNEMRALEKEILSLKKRLEQAEYIIKIINQADAVSMKETFSMKKQQEKLHLMTRKLKVTEYKLQIREQELQALYADRYKNKAKEEDSRAREDTNVILPSQQRQQEVKRKEQEESMMHYIKKRRLLQSVNSLGSLAYQLLHSSAAHRQQQQISEDSPRNYKITTDKETYPLPASITATVVETVPNDDDKKRAVMK